ncbi:MAG TPA: tripartite tricarboxylate transporter substrate binding protein [Xanthobacteraceae bacterium]|nr:tripartite tricarboxylate transporter substrate binding protein [Xanthobacteraceae bacterium]
MERSHKPLAGLRFFAPLLAAITLLAAPVRADTIKIVVPFAAGGPVDQLARLLTPELATQLKADVIVDDRGGAGGAIASELVAHAAPDGDTILLTSMGAQILSPILKPPTTYDPVKDLVPVMMVAAIPSLLVVNHALGVTTMKDLIAKAKAQKLTYGSAGPGTTMNIALEMLNNAAGVKITHVPYRGAAPAINDLLGGHVDMLNADLPVLLPLVKAGTVTPIALFASERTPLLPDLPTTKQLGLPSVVMESWYGVFLPVGTPAPVRDKLEHALLAVVATPLVKQRFAELGMHGTLGREAFEARLKQDYARWPETITKLGITGE